MRCREYTGNGTVLVVDDEPGTVRLLGSILKSNATVFAALNAEDALKFIKTTPPDLILLDANLPDMDGYALCAALQNDAVTEEMPIIFVTADTSPDAETRALDAGAIDFIGKPINPPVVEARVKLHLELKARGDRLRSLSRIDGLTGVSNRRAFDEVMATEWRRAMRYGAVFSLLMVDIDHFKDYNDTYGHLEGDQCLKAVAACLESSVQRAGDVVARYGGEEFAILLPESPAPEAWTLAERICANVEALGIAHERSRVSPHVTISVGAGTIIFGCPEDPRARHACAQCGSFVECQGRSDRLIALADKALYEAKYRGRAQVAAKIERLAVNGLPVTVPFEAVASG